MWGQDRQVIRTILDNLLGVAAVLHYVVEFFKNTLELVVERGRSARLLVLILDDALVIGNLYPSTL